MNRIFLLLVKLLLRDILNSQTISTSRTTNWSAVGLNSAINEPPLLINILNEGADNNGLTPNDALINSLTNNIPVSGAIIFFPDGQYLFNQKINLKSNIIIRGESTNNTILNFNLGGMNNCIQISGNLTSIEANIINNLNKDQTIFNVSNASLFNVGDIIILSDNDNTKVTSSWALNSTGQILEITAISGTQITIKNPLRRNYLLTDNPKIIKINPKKIFW